MEPTAQQLTVRPISPGEEEAASELVRSVFMQSVAPSYRPEGVAHFLRYASAEAMRDRRGANHFQLVAALGARLVGYIEVRGFSHVCMLFVDPDHQGRGIARSLLGSALELCIRALPDLPKITMNAAPDVVAAYERLGFTPVDEQRVVNGIAFVPMERALEGDPG